MLYIIVASIFYTAAIMLGTVASRHANTNLVAAIINMMGALVPVGVLVPIMNNKLFTNSRYGIIMAVLAGIAIAIFSMALTKSYSENKVGIVAPLILGGAIFLSAILSSLIFKEKITPFQGGGLALLGLGLLLIIYARATGR